MENYRLTTYQGTPTQQKLGKVMKWSFIALVAVILAQSLSVPAVVPVQFSASLSLALRALVWICIVLLGVSLVWGTVDWYRDVVSRPTFSLFADGYSLKRPFLTMVGFWGGSAVVLLGITLLLGGSLQPISSTLFCLFVPTAIGVGMGALIEQQRRNALQHIAAIFDHGQQAEATIIDSWEDPDSESSTRYVAYRFTADIDGTPREIVQREQEDEYTKLYQVGDTLPVYYLPEQPKVAMLEPHYQAARQQPA